MDWIVKMSMMTILMTGLCRGDEQEHLQGRSFVSAYLSNLDAVNSCDVAWRFETQWVADNGEIDESVVIGRLTLDDASKQFCGVRHATRSELVPSAKGAKEQRVVALQATVSDGKQTWLRFFPKKADRLARTDPEYAFTLADMPFLFGVGLGDFPIPYQQSRQFEQHKKYLRHGDIRFSLGSATADSQTVRYRMPIAKDVDLQRSIDFDQVTFAPLRASQATITPQGTFTNYRETYEFEEIDGVFLPIRIVGEKRKQHRKEDERIPGISSYEVKFKWFSVNEGAKDLDYGGRLLTDIRAVTELVSPKIFNE